MTTPQPAALPELPESPLRSECWHEGKHHTSFYTADQMDARYLRGYNDALAALQSQPAAAGVSDAEIDALIAEYLDPVATYPKVHTFARAILALRPQAVPMTDEQIEAMPIWTRFVGLWPETRKDIVRAVEAHHGITAQGAQAGEVNERVEDSYGSTDIPWSFTVCRELEPQEKRLMSMLVSAFGSSHPAIDDMAHLILNRPASLPAQPAARVTPATPEDMKVYDGIAADYFADTQQATPEPVTLGPLAKRNIYDAIRGAYDLGYNDARNARTVPGDSAPGYDGRSVEEDHGGALFNLLSRGLKPATPPQQAAGEPVGEVYGWAVTGLSFIWRGEHAQACAEQEAKTCGGTSIAFPLFTRPAPGVPEGFALVPIKSDDAILRPFYNCPPEELGLAWDAAMRVAQVRLAAAQAKGGEHG